MNRLIAAFLFICISCTGTAQLPYWISVGPEVYHFSRVRDGGTFQDGPIDGLRGCIERIKPCGLYIGADYLYATGNIKGKTARGSPLKSVLTDNIWEIRLGYTLQKCEARYPFFTPFAGWGYFEEVNDFHPPSPLPCKFTDTFNYIVVGFLSGVNFTSLVSMGINFKVKFMQDGKSKVSDDPVMDDITMIMKDEMQVRLDVPFTYSPCNSWLGIGFQLSPFYEYRHFGGREGYPFNFRDTKFYLYGARFAFIYRF